MRFGDERESSNFEDVTGRSGGLGGGGLGGGGLGCLLPLVASRFGIGGVIVLVIGYFLLSSLGGLGGGGGGGLMPATQQSAPAGQSTLDPNTRHFMLQVLASTEDMWSKLLQPKGIRYTPTNLVAYSQRLSVGLRRGAVGDGAVLLPDRQEDLSRHRILQRTFAALPGARRLRAGLCDCA